MVSTWWRNLALTMCEPLVHVFSRHLTRDPEVDRDFPVREFMDEPQHYRSAAFRSELPQYHLELTDALSCVELRL